MSKKKPNGFYKHMTDRQFKGYIKREYARMIVSELAERDRLAYNEANRRGILDELVERGILMRERRSCFKNMTDKEFDAYVIENHVGKTTTDFNKDRGAYLTAVRRGLFQGYVKRGILIRTRKPASFYKKMTREQLSAYIEAEYNGLPIGEFEDKAPYLCDIARKNKTAEGKTLVDELVEKGVLLRLYRPKKYWQDITTEQLNEEIKIKYEGKSLTWFARRDGCMYHAALNRKLPDGKSLIDELVERGVLIRRRFGGRTKLNVSMLLEDLASAEGGRK